MKAGFRNNLDTIYSEDIFPMEGIEWFDLPNNFNLDTHRAVLNNGILSILTIEDFEITKNNNKARIVDIQIDPEKDFRSVDLNTELKQGLNSVEHYGELQSNRGLLLKKVYFKDDLEILQIDYDYKFDNINQISEQEVILRWYNNDGSFNDLVKDKGWIKFSDKESTRATVKRREAIIEQLKSSIKQLLSSSASNELELNDSISLGNDLISDVSLELDKFEKSGKSSDLISKLNTLTVKYPLLDMEMTPNTGFTVIDYITNFLNY